MTQSALLRKWLRDEGGRKRGLLLAVCVEDEDAAEIEGAPRTVYIGWSQWHKGADAFSEQMAEDVAFGWASQAEERGYFTPAEALDFLDGFPSRVARRLGRFVELSKKHFRTNDVRIRYPEVWWHTAMIARRGVK